MITAIGIVAGEIWEYLDKTGSSVPLEELVSGIERPRDAVLMSVGWLAREGHIVVEETVGGRTVKLVQR
ncbi:MAG: winged helix-turn-helix domain-containing protein [Candidatus Omnitrophota bacterium]